MMLLFLTVFACRSTKTIEDRLGESLLGQLQTDQPNILVDKSDEKLYVIRGGSILKLENEAIHWDISLGTVPEGHKEKEGDKKTPEGLYRYTDYSASSSYHGSLLIHYPSPIDAASAVEDGRISVSIQKEIEKADKQSQPPPMLTGMGGYILVHGTHKKGEKLFPSNVRYLYTDGCVGMSNDDIDELREYLDEDGAVKKGKILIVP
jgi:murein L,D-transpeptidase YafK